MARVPCRCGRRVCKSLKGLEPHWFRIIYYMIYSILSFFQKRGELKQGSVSVSAKRSVAMSRITGIIPFSAAMRAAARPEAVRRSTFALPR